MPPLSSKENISDVVSTILAHHKKNRRSFPWRETTDPYHILVSEYMLQQTQAERVVPKYKDFLQRFPDVISLMRANRKDVLVLWSGLGYNRRAVALHNSAKIIADEHNGIVPNTKEELLTLPGIGDYTASAVLAFAHNKPTVVIETNIRTVVLHHCARKKREVTDSTIAFFIKQLLRHTLERNVSPRIFYSAMMDYGAHLKTGGVRVNMRSKNYTKQKKFDGSVRQARGTLLRVFITNKTGTSEKQLKKQLKEIQPQRISEGLAGLITDGLVEKRKGYYYLVE